MHCEKKGKRRDSLLMTNTHSNVLISINICSIERDITSLRVLAILDPSISRTTRFASAFVFAFAFALYNLQ